jgi:hypothetical protein
MTKGEEVSDRLGVDRVGNNLPEGSWFTGEERYAIQGSCIERFDSKWVPGNDSGTLYFVPKNERVHAL